MMNAASLPLNILLISASLLCIFLIFYFYRITKSINQIKDEIKNISAQLEPFIKSVNELSDNFNSISNGIKQPVEMVSSSVNEVKKRVDLILNLEEKIRKGVEDPIVGLITTFSAVVKSIETFWKTYNKR